MSDLGSLLYGAKPTPDLGLGAMLYGEPPTPTEAPLPSGIGAAMEGIEQAAPPAPEPGQTYLSAEPPKSAIAKLGEYLFGQSPEASRAKAANIEAIATADGKRPSEVSRGDYAQASRDVGGGEPTTAELAGTAAMIGGLPVAVAHPVATALAIPAFEGATYLARRGAAAIAGKPYEPGVPTSEYLPEQAGPGLRTLADIGEQVVAGAAAGGVVGGLKFIGGKWVRGVDVAPGAAGVEPRPAPGEVPYNSPPKERTMELQVEEAYRGPGRPAARPSPSSPVPDLPVIDASTHPKPRLSVEGTPYRGAPVARSNVPPFDPESGRSLSPYQSLRNAPGEAISPEAASAPAQREITPPAAPEATGRPVTVDPIAKEPPHAQAQAEAQGLLRQEEVPTPGGAAPITPGVAAPLGASEGAIPPNPRPAGAPEPSPAPRSALEVAEGELRRYVDRTTRLPMEALGADEAGALRLGERPAPPQYQPTPVHTFSDPAVEARFQAKSVNSRPGFWQRTREGLVSLGHKATREFEHLPDTGEFAPLRYRLLELGKQGQVSQDRAVRNLQGLTAMLDDPALPRGVRRQEHKAAFDLFRRKVVVDDLTATLARDPEAKLPYGLTAESLPAEKARLDAMAEQSPRVAQALEMRRKLWDGMREEYKGAMEAIGEPVEHLTREDWFHHQVLDYANAMEAARARRPGQLTTKDRGFLKQRKGSERDISSDYLMVEHEVMSRMLQDIEVAKVKLLVDEKYNIRPRLEAEASAAGGRVVVPEGYAEVPLRGTNGAGDSVHSQAAHEAFVNALVRESGLPREKILAAMDGAEGRKMIVPQAVADTLANLAPPPPGWMGRLLKPGMDAWKRWQLLSPRRAIKYNLRNTSGDSEALFIGNPSAFREVPRAATDIYRVFAGDRSMSADMQHWFARGGMQTTMTGQDVSKLRVFRRFYDEAGGGLAAKMAAPAKAYWRTVEMGTAAREAVLRYAAYLDYVRQMQANPEGRPNNFGASKPENIMALSDIRDRAFHLSNELLGAYDRVSVVGQGLSTYVAPFWRWQEVNFKRYIQLFRNAASDGNLAETMGRKLAGTALSPYTYYKLGKLAIKASALWAGMEAWNQLMYPKEEADLPRDIRGRPHIVLGRDADGQALYFTNPGIAGDFMEWFGLDAAPQLARDLVAGYRTWKDVAQDMALSPVEKAIRVTGPQFKLPAELASRRALYPEPFKPTTIRDRGEYVARTLTLQDEYKALMGKPSRGYLKSLGDLAVYRTDPGEAAYSDAQNLERLFMKKLGKESEGFWLTPKGDAIYNFKLALRHGDTKAAQRYLREYVELGGDDKGFEQSIKRMAPGAGMNQQEQEAFALSLTPADRHKIMQAQDFYRRVLSGNTAK